MSPRMAHAINPDHPTPKRISRQALQRLWGWLRPYRGRMLVNIVLSLILTAVGLVTPLVLQYAIDGVVEAVRGVEAAQAAETAAAAGGPAPEAGAGADAVRARAWSDLLPILLGFGALFFVSQGLRFVEIRRTIRIAQEFLYEMRGRFFSHLHALSFNFYDRWKAGQLIARGTTDMDTLQETVSWAPSHLCSSVFMILGATAIMLVKDWKLFLAVSWALPVLVVLTTWFRVRATAAWRDVRYQTGRLTANVAESIAGARVIQAFAREDHNMRIFGDLTSTLYGTRVETQKVHSGYMVGMRATMVMASVIVLGFGAYRIQRGEVTPGEVGAFLGYVGMFFRPMDMLSHVYNQLLHSLAAADRVIEVLDAEPDIVDAPDAVDPEDFEGTVAFEDVTFEYVEGTPVLKDVAFKAEPGEVIALVGPTGAGKTTFCRLVSRFYEPQQGTVRIDQWPVQAIRQAALHRRMGIVLQENFLFAGTVMENIRYGRPDATDEEVIACAKRIGSHDAIDALPRGYETKVGERGQTLSAGQRQLVCFTRAMLADPRFLILDEATSSVDTQTELNIQEALRRLTEKRTCFIVAHRLSTVRRADRVIVIEDGCITEQGTHRELMEAGGRYAHMYEAFIRSE